MLLARAVTYGVVLILGAIAVAFTPRLPDPKPAAAVIESAPSPSALAAPVWRERSDTLARGETLTALLGRAAIVGRDLARVLESATPLHERRVPAGLALVSRTLESDSIPSELIFQLAVDHILTVRRSDSGWVSTEETLPVGDRHHRAWRVDHLDAVRRLRRGKERPPRGESRRARVGTRRHLRVSCGHESGSAAERCVPRTRRTPARTAGRRAPRLDSRRDVHALAARSCRRFATSAAMRALATSIRTASRCAPHSFAHRSSSVASPACSACASIRSSASGGSMRDRLRRVAGNAGALRWRRRRDLRRTQGRLRQRDRGTPSQWLRDAATGTCEGLRRRRSAERASTLVRPSDSSA